MCLTARKKRIENDYRKENNLTIDQINWKIRQKDHGSKTRWGENLIKTKRTTRQIVFCITSQMFWI